jgi:hypothetical protein
MDAGFRESVESLHSSFQRLTSMPAVSANELPKLMPRECIYLFSENGNPMYVGRTRKLRQRLRNRSGQVQLTTRRFLLSSWHASKWGE